MRTALIATPRLKLNLLGVEDLDPIRRYYLNNADHLEPWEPVRDQAFHGLDAWRARIEVGLTEIREGRATRLVIRRSDAQDIIGVANFTNVQRGPFQACTLGYSIASNMQGRGYMFEALDAAIRFMFETQGLHRIMANYIPENDRSARLLKKLGFEEEGFARNYLHIAGQWRDHVLTSKVNPDFSF